VQIRTRTDVINYLIRLNGYRRYLEIGVRRPEQNFARVRAAEKEGVDPAPLGPITHTMTSDEFFASRPDDAPGYDVVLIDGLHLEAQVLRDVDGALANLSPAGTVVLHDCNPPDEPAQLEEYDGTSTWNGTVWKAWAKLRMSRPDLTMFVVDTDWGVGVITRGEQETAAPATDDELTFDYLDTNRVALLNLISPDDFEAHAQATYGREAPSAASGLRSRLRRG
jgi:Methyltransferase domain